MAFNKIQPEQIQLATFFSNSGDIHINQTDTGVKLNLSRLITGNFGFTGDAARPFKINSRQVLFAAEENSSNYTQQATFTNATTGAVIFSDFEANPTETKGNATMVVDFTSGSYFEGGNTYHLNNIHVRSASSGLFSGDLNVLGDTFLSGVGVSGVATFNTGFTLPQYIGTDMAGTSGALAVSGEKVAVYLTGGWVGLGTTSL